MNERDDCSPSRRLVLLGASNVRLSLGAAIGTAQHFLGKPLSVLTAIGHGRSYGQMTSVLGRQLTGITQCGLWPELDRQKGLPTNALITDIGNDLLFGVTPKQISEWVGQCIDRLLEHEAQIVITRLPLANFESLSPARFRLFRSILFPRHRESLSAMKQLAAETDARIGELGETYPVTLIQPSPEWYGLDPIHLKYRRWLNAYEILFSSWCADQSDQPKKVTWRDHLQAARWRGEERIVFGRRRSCRQPSGRFHNETIVSLY